MDYRAYTRRNAETVSALQRVGHRASVESLAGGFYGVSVPLEGGYHVHLAQDLDGNGEWFAGVSHRSEPDVTIRPDGTSSGNTEHDYELGLRHPKDAPAMVKEAAQHFAPRVMKHAQTQRQNRNLGQQFG